MDNDCDGAVDGDLVATCFMDGDGDGYGNVVLIEHEGYVITVYAHQSKLSVSKGNSLDAGDPIGECGSTGWSTGPHLHFEVRVGGEVKDPLLVLPA